MTKLMVVTDSVTGACERIPVECPAVTGATGPMLSVVNGQVTLNVTSLWSSFGLVDCNNAAIAAGSHLATCTNLAAAEADAIAQANAYTDGRIAALAASIPGAGQPILKDCTGALIPLNTQVPTCAQMNAAIAAAIAAIPPSPGGAPTGPAGGALAGNYPNPTLSPAGLTDAANASIAAICANPDSIANCIASDASSMATIAAALPAAAPFQFFPVNTLALDFPTQAATRNADAWTIDPAAAPFNVPANAKMIQYRIYTHMSTDGTQTSGWQTQVAHDSNAVLSEVSIGNADTSANIEDDYVFVMLPNEVINGTVSTVGTFQQGVLTSTARIVLFGYFV